MILKECGLNVNREQRELNPHGTAAFPCAAYLEMFEGDCEDGVPWHWHEEIEVIYIEAGIMEVQLPGKSFHGKAGDCFFINSNILHAVMAKSDLEICSMVFHPSLISGQEDSVFSQKYVKPLLSCGELPGCLIMGGAEGTADAIEACSDWRKQFISAFLAAFTAVQEEPDGFEFSVREHLSLCLLLLCRQFEGQIRSDPMELDQDNLRIRVMLEVIQEHFSEDIGLSRIAGAAGIGERECLRCFKRVLRLSPVQYLIRYRVMKGAEMLSEKPGSSIAEISSLCGFDSPSNFSQTFRRFYGCTPREYRRSRDTEEVLR